MSMVVLILLLLAGGLVTWQLERINANLPRWAALATVTLALLYLLSVIAQIPAENFQLTPDPRDGASWLLHFKLAWIPRFGISLELAMDGTQPATGDTDPATGPDRHRLLLVGNRFQTGVCSRLICCGPWPESAGYSWPWTCSCSSCSGK